MSNTTDHAARSGDGLLKAFESTFDIMKSAAGEYAPHLETEETGIITFLGEGVVRVAGLPSVQSEELVLFPDNRLGMAFNLEENQVAVVLLDKAANLRAGAEVRRSRRVMDVPVGDAVIGRVLDPLGRPLDTKGPIRTSERLPIERKAPGILERLPVSEPVQTGVQIIDALIPIGRGQRELILGDRQTGKTAIALDTILNQRDTDIVCIYCAIGQESSTVAKVAADLESRGAMEYTAVIAATGEDAAGLNYVAPYAATSMGEYFMQQGRDALIVYDDLTKHARSYRELSLLLRRPPAREAYPGDIFYIHSRLLERSTHLKASGGSLTALPIIETQAQNVSAYIPTNLISITDGQVYVNPQLYQAGILPAVDVGKSVSRVGGKTQLPAYRAVAGDLRLAYSQFEELEAFARFGTRLDEQTRKTLERGRRVREVFKQPQYEPIPVAEQLATLIAVNSGAFDELATGQLTEAKQRVRQEVTAQLPKICRKISDGRKLDEGEIKKIEQTARKALSDMTEPDSAQGKSGGEKPHGTDEFDEQGKTKRIQARGKGEQGE